MRHHRIPIHRFDFRQQSLLCSLLILLILLNSQAIASDLPGAKDHPLLKRFGGSEIVGYEQKRFADYDIQTSTFTSYDLKNKTRVYAAPPLHLEGALTRIWYESQGETSSLELFRNYYNELTLHGFEILYDSTKDNPPANWTGFLNPYNEITIQTSRSNYVFRAADYQGIKVLTAKKARPEGDLYVSLNTRITSYNVCYTKLLRGPAIHADFEHQIPFYVYYA